MGEDDSIWIETLVSHSTGEPGVVISWHDHRAQMTPIEARGLAFQLLEAAEVANSDAFLIKFFSEKIGTERQRAVMVLQEFREYREEQDKNAETS